MGGFLSSAASIIDKFGSSVTPARLGISGPTASLINRIYYSTQAGIILSAGQSGPWRPSQWGRSVPLTLSATDSQSGKATVYVFDGILRAEHQQPSVITLNPVQTGAPITDHAYRLPARVVVEIAMSDAMQSYDVNQWNNGPTRSVSAHQTLVSMQAARQVLQLATKLRQYDQMLIADIRAVETKETTYGLHAVVTFLELLTAQVESTGAWRRSAIPQATAESLLGQAQTVPVPSNVQSQNSISKLLGSAGAPKSLPGIAAALPGAGNWSSTMNKWAPR